MKRRGLSRLLEECSPPPPLGGSERTSRSQSHRPRRERGRLAAPVYVQPPSRYNARHFDYSEPVTLSVTAFGAMPYRPFASRADYDLSSGQSVGYVQSRTHGHSQPFYVEPFEAGDEAVPASEEAARYEDVEVGGQPGHTPRPARSAAEGDRAAQLAELERRESEEFEADIRQILEGKKRYEASQRGGPGKTIEAPRPGVAASPASAAAPAPAPASAREEQPKDEHAIFERIAQSMKLANAYDLGSVALNQRLDAFDREMEASRQRQAAAAKPPPPQKPPVAATPPAPAQRTTEFLEDMDEMGPSTVKPDDAQNGGKTGSGKHGAAAVSSGNGGSTLPAAGVKPSTPSESAEPPRDAAGTSQSDAGTSQSDEGDEESRSS